MILLKQTIHDPIPEGAKKIINRGEETTIYFADDLPETEPFDLVKYQNNIESNKIEKQKQAERQSQITPDLIRTLIEAINDKSKREKLNNFLLRDDSIKQKHDLKIEKIKL